MALYTVDGVLTKVKILIEEANDTNVVTENELITLVNEAQKWVAAESGSYQAWDTITLAASTVRYSPPADTVGVISLEYDYDDRGVRPVIRVEPDTVPNSATDIEPYYWFYRANFISIFPSMPVEPEDTTMNVLFTKEPAALTELTDSLVIPDEFQIVVPYRVAKDVAVKDNQFEKAAFLTTEIERLTKVGIAQYAHRSGAVSAPGGDSGASG